MKTQTETKSVLLVEDDGHTCKRLTQAIQSHSELSVCKACRTLEEGLNALLLLEPDALVTDLGLPDGSGIQLIRKVRQVNRKMEIMVISIFGDERNVIAAIEAGASGYLLKDDEDADLGNAIVRMLAGESPISAAIARHLLKRFHGKSTQAPGTNRHGSKPVLKLTERETEVLQCMAKGYTYQEAAAMLEMSPHTVNSHIKRIYCKLEVNSRSEAVFEAVQLGLVEI
ncbi:MAG TPA: response regulator transcription factor [Gammaproteobacteria bacterium]|nr:response regulator transcription factor [Gammaproteobacteria bacterium]